ncbi:MAG: extracellular solute-binding protein [Patescibacteria group bacterium]
MFQRYRFHHALRPTPHAPLRRWLALLLLPALLGQGCTNAPSSEAAKLSTQTTLTVWSAVDDQSNYNSIITAFHAQYPYVTIVFKKFRLEEYESQLLNAMAEDRGPDVFMIHNDWVGKYQPKILPQPPQVKVAQEVVSGRNKVMEVQTATTESPTQMKKDFVDVVAQDAIRKINVSTDAKKTDMQERVFGIPMSVDTLALYYNKDLLNASGIATPPETWGDFQKQVEKLTVIDAGGNITRSGAAFGTGANVERSPDIIALLMMQNRQTMADQNGYPAFTKIPPDVGTDVQNPPAYDAIRFYTDFADPQKSVYTWNASQPNSLDAFTRGNAAFFFGYSYHLPIIRSQAPKLNLGITHVPQIENTPVVNFANYWMWTVSKKTKSPDLAWHFVNQITNQENEKAYLDLTKHPAARRALIDAQLDSADVGVFASQVLTATSWYRGVDPQTMEQAFMTMADSVVSGTAVNDAAKFASQTISQTITSQ